MTREELLKELSQLKAQQVSCRGTQCSVYGKNKTTVQSRVNGCCITPSKGAKMKRFSKGFTLLELLVAVLIVVILASIAWAQYLKAVERSRMSEAVALLANISNAQERKFIQINHFSTSFMGLDVTPKGASGDKYCTKGLIAPSTYENTACGDGNGFVIQLSADTAYNRGKATALRSAPRGLQYQYELERYYANYGTLCTALNEEAKSLCADFCGVDEYTGPCCTVAGNAIEEGDLACGVPSLNLHGTTSDEEEE